MKHSNAHSAIQEQLPRWKQGVVSVSDIKAWADSLLRGDEFDDFIDDWTENEEFSVVLEILRLLEMAHIELLIPEDIPALEELLTSPSTEAFTKRSTEYFARIDYSKGRAALKESLFYVTDRVARTS